MALRRILQIEDPEDLKVLKTRSMRVTRFDAALHRLVDDLLETLRDASGAGLAAPQVGVLQRVVVIDEQPELELLEDGTRREIAPGQLYVLVNPEIIKASEERIPVLEGCLSLPGIYGEVLRHTWVTVNYQDLNGKQQRLRRVSAHNYRVGHMAQHEIDHLNGVLFTERVTDLCTLRDYRQRTS